MDHESEVIRQQMEETRSSLADKLETLEQQVVGTVHDTTSAVANTVETVREAVNDSVDKVKDSVDETVAAVRDTFDVQRQVDRHPWAMMAGSVLLGYVGGSLLNRAEQGRSRVLRPSPVYSELDYAPRREPVNGGGGRLHRTEPQTPSNSSRAESTEPSWLAEVGKTYEKEISKLKGLAIGTMMGIVRDLVATSLPDPLKPEMQEVMDSVTVKLGGEPVRGPVLSESWLNQPQTPESEYCRSDLSKKGRPLGATYR